MGGQLFLLDGDADWLAPTPPGTYSPARNFEEIWGRVKESPSVFRLLLGMSRHLRFIPDGGALVEVTCRTVQGRLLLAPSPQLNDIILGVLGRAQRLYPVEIAGYVFVSNHFLCAAPHKKCYGECPVMWSWRPRPNGCAGNGGGCCA